MATRRIQSGNFTIFYDDSTRRASVYRGIILLPPQSSPFRSVNLIGLTSQELSELDEPTRNALNNLVQRPASNTRQQQNRNSASALGRQNSNTNNWVNKKVVSLGTLIMAFVAKPLSELKDTSSNNQNKPKFEEVQVIFYNFNNKASLMSHCNISQFPVQTSYFVREYARFRQESVSRAVQLSVAEFMSFIQTKIVDDVMNPAYKISDLYKPNQTEVTIREGIRPLPDNSTSQERSSRIRRPRPTNRDNFDAVMLERMKNYNISNHSDFVMPIVTFELEALPAPERNGGTILRIHVYDQAASSRTHLRELLSLSTNNFMNTLSSYVGGSREAVSARLQAAEQQTQNSSSNLLQNWRELQNAMISRATQLGLIRRISGENAYEYVGGPQKLKEYVMKNVPHIIYGAMATNVKSANLSSMSDSRLNSINMQRSLNASPILPNGAQIGGVPLSLYPVELNITTVGCSLLRNRGQEIFVDFNTNTTADNIYVVNGFQHKIEPGTFETTIKLIAQDSFGQYRNLIEQLNSANNLLNEYLGEQENNTATPTNTTTTNPTNNT